MTGRFLPLYLQFTVQGIFCLARRSIIPLLHISPPVNENMNIKVSVYVCLCLHPAEHPDIPCHIDCHIEENSTLIYLNYSLGFNLFSVVVSIGKSVHALSSLHPIFKRGSSLSIFSDEVAAQESLLSFFFQVIDKLGRI